jgi:hypothetical protein
MSDTELAVRIRALLADSPFHGEGLSYPEFGSRGIEEPLPATPLMAGSGGGWIAKGWVIEDRAIVGSAAVFTKGPERIRV